MISSNLRVAMSQSDFDRNDVEALPPTANEVQPASSPQNRRTDRFPLYCTLRYTPIEHAGSLLHEDSINIFGKNMSVAGMGFSHDGLLLHPRGVISHSDSAFGTLAVEVEIIWTKQNSLDCYESGVGPTKSQIQLWKSAG
jgi:hypothetical protein